jgi:glycosyltransferase involved in cell wall biosynthesis
MKYITPEDHYSIRRDVHPSQRQHHVEPVSSPLYVVTAITNPERFYSRYKLYRPFEKMCEDAGAVLYTIELALRDRHHEITQHDNPRHIQLRSPSQIWHKENLLNIAMHRLPADAEYIAWVDADIQFARPDWVVETIHQLQHFHIVQMFSHAQDVSPNHDLGNGRVLGGPHQSFLCSYNTGVPLPDYLRRVSGNQSYGSYPADKLWHSGYCWAARRSALSDLGGLGDIAILGSADHHMAAALIGKVNHTIHGSMHPNFKKYWSRWQDRAERHIKRNVGYVPGLILHYWHGPKASRKYIDRWKILVDEQYDPEQDIKYDFQGVLQLTDRNIRLRDKIRSYFRAREEDDTRVE